MSRVVARAPLSMFEDGVPVRLEYPPFDVVAVVIGGMPLAIEDACNHAGASLAEGPVEDGNIMCPMHGFVFSLSTGKLIVPEGLCEAQRTYRATIEGEELVVYDDFEMALKMP